SLRRVEADAVQDGKVGAVREAHVRETQVAERGVERERVRALDDIGRKIEVFEDPLEQRQRRLDVDVDGQELVDRNEQTVLVRRERDDVAEREPAADDLVAADEPDHGRRRGPEGLDGHEEPAADHRLADPDATIVVAYAGETADLVVVAPEDLYELRAGDAEGL